MVACGSCDTRRDTTFTDHASFAVQAIDSAGALRCGCIADLFFDDSVCGCIRSACVPSGEVAEQHAHAVSAFWPARNRRTGYFSRQAARGHEAP